MNLIEQLELSPIQLTDKGFSSQMQLGSFHAQPQGYLNGGATLAAAEILAGMASNELLDDEFFAVGQTVSGNHLRPKKAEGTLEIRGELLHQGRTSHVWELRFLDKASLISLVTVTNVIVKS